tara:strand:+ start:128 stop:1015 length:888 start_codon:yes stop_codon:yes gene_type:complete
MLPEYTKESLLPLSLFNFHDNQEFKTYSDILKSNSPHLNKAEAYVSSCLKQYENQHLLIQLLLLFPNIAFSSISEFDLGELLNVKSVHNKEKLRQVLNFRFNISFINDILDEIEKTKGTKIDRKLFYTDFFIFSYKYFFIELADSIKWVTYKTNNDIYNDLEITVNDFINKAKKVNKDLKILNNTSFERIQLNKLNEQFDNSFGFNYNSREKNIKELKVFTLRHNLAKTLYSIIDSSIVIPPQLNTKDKNKLLRPLFKEIVCKVCYPKVFDKSYSSNDLNIKFRTFLITYKKSLQ